MSRIYKILRLAEWEEALGQSVFRGSPDDLRDGFIHFSTREQVPGTIAKYFAADEVLIIAMVEEAAVGEALRWEASRGGALFPHLYAELPLGLIEETIFVHRQPGDLFEWPDPSS